MKQRQQKKLSRRLFGAVLAGDARGTKALLRSGASPDGRNSDGTTPLYLASVQGEAEIARSLMEAGASPDTESSGPGSEGTPLCAAAYWGHNETVRQLLAYGADPNRREDHGQGGPHWTGRTMATALTLPKSFGQQGRNRQLTRLRSRRDLGTHFRNRPWASILYGTPGDLHAERADELGCAAQELGVSHVELARHPDGALDESRAPARRGGQPPSTARCRRPGLDAATGHGGPLERRVRHVLHRAGPG